MVSRRALLASSLLAPIAATSAAAPATESPTDPVTLADLERAFTGYDADARELIQSSMQTTGFYEAGIDGEWGPGMKAAFTGLMQTPAYRDAAALWDWPLEVRVIETLFFVSSDAYID